MESPEPSADKRPTEEGRKDSEAVRAPRTDRRELGWRGIQPAKQSPQVWLAKAEGPDGLCSHNKRDLASGRSQVNSSARKRKSWRTKGGRVAETPDNRAQFGGEQRRSPTPSPSPIPQPKSQREPLPARELACIAQTSNAVLLRIHPSGSGSDSLLAQQGPHPKWITEG